MGPSPECRGESPNRHRLHVFRGREIARPGKTDGGGPHVYWPIGDRKSLQRSVFGDGLEYRREEVLPPRLPIGYADAPLVVRDDVGDPFHIGCIGGELRDGAAHFAHVIVIHVLRHSWKNPRSSWCRDDYALEKMDEAARYVDHAAWIRVCERNW